MCLRLCVCVYVYVYVYVCVYACVCARALPCLVPVQLELAVDHIGNAPGLLRHDAEAVCLVRCAHMCQWRVTGAQMGERVP